MSLSTLGADIYAANGGVCVATCSSLYILGMIATFVTTWRRGRRVPLWNDEDGRRRAALAAGASPAVADELARANKINAIKVCREETGLGLKEAKDAVDGYERALYRYEPWPSMWAALKGMK